MRLITDVSNDLLEFDMSGLAAFCGDDRFQLIDAEQTISLIVT